MDEREFSESITSMGGSAFAVGGWVRDMLLQRAASDKDYVVSGVAQEAFAAGFPSARLVGSSFPVYLLEIGGQKCEVAFARRERKVGRGYRGFAATFDESVTIEEDLYRRDLTINSMAVRLATGELIDPYGGEADIRGGLIRATSHHFSEDPVRALRAARQSAQLGFAVEPRTIELMRCCGGELCDEPRERVFLELEKAMSSLRPSLFFRALHSAGLLQIIFPWLFNLIGKEPPPQYHPEGDAFEHSLEMVDKVAAVTERPEVRFAALAHDLGKGAPRADESSMNYYLHDKAGVTILDEMDRGLGLPRLWKQCAQIVVEEHMRARMISKPAKIRELLTAVARNPIGLSGFCVVIEADRGFLPEFLADHEAYMAAIAAVQKLAIPEELEGAAVGNWRRHMETQAVATLMRSRKTPV